MTITREELDRAAFWDHAVCLDCAVEFEVEADDSVLDDIGRPVRNLGPCPDCGSPRTYQATTVLDILERVEGEEE